jgi:hypothetical protein
MIKDIQKNINDRLRRCKNLHNVFKALQRQGFNVDISEVKDGSLITTELENPVMMAEITKGVYNVKTYFVEKTQAEQDKERQHFDKYGCESSPVFPQYSIYTVY